MKLRIATVIIAAALIGGCGTKTIIVEATTSVPTTVVETTTGVDGYFSAVMDSYPDAINVYGRKFIVDFGETVCGAIDEGTSLNQIANMVPEGGDIALIAYMIRQAILNICPRNQWFLDAASQA